MTTRSLTHISFLFLFSQLFNVSWSQEPPMKWGEISPELLKMKTYPPDTNAAAVILCDYGTTSFNDELNLVFKRHLRVKILSPAGYEWGTHSILINEEDDLDQIDDIEGITYSLGTNGDLGENELDSDDIFKEKVENELYRYRFTLPALTPGCIVEIRYTIISNNLYRIRDWVFQYSEPALWSEYRLTTPKSIGYTGVTQGYEQFTINEQTDVLQHFGSTALAYLGPNPAECAQYRWALRNAPALRKEAYITTVGDYANKVDLQLSGYAFVGGGVRRVLTTWENLVEELLDAKWFCDKISTSGTIEDLANSITTGLTPPEDKMKALYHWVSQSIVWDGAYRRYADQDPEDVVESKKGNNAEISFLLISLLRSAGITADPVLLSTRANGRVQDLYPIESQFNYVLVFAAAGPRTFLLDATDPLRPYDILPSSVLNVKGLLIKEGPVRWLTIVTPLRSLRSGVASVTLRGDGTLAGKVAEQYDKYAALSVRRDLKDKKDIDIARDELAIEGSAMRVDSALATGKDSLSAPLQLRAWISSESYAQAAGDLIYLNPHVIARVSDNPFKIADRKYPVDYGYPRQQTATITIEIPEGYEVKEAPANRTFTVGRNDVVFQRLVEKNASAVQLFTKFQINEAELPATLYKNLKEFYSNMVAAQSEQLVLAKKPIPTPPLASPQPQAKPGSKKGKGKS